MIAAIFLIVVIAIVARLVHLHTIQAEFMTQHSKARSVRVLPINPTLRFPKTCGISAGGRVNQSMVFFNTPGIPQLYSGVLISVAHRLVESPFLILIQYVGCCLLFLCPRCTEGCLL